MAPNAGVRKSDANAKEQPVEVVVEDRYLISVHESITVKLEEKSSGQANE